LAAPEPAHVVRPDPNNSRISWPSLIVNSVLLAYLLHESVTDGRRCVNFPWCPPSRSSRRGCGGRSGCQGAQGPGPARGWAAGQRTGRGSRPHPHPGDLCRPSGPDSEGQAEGQARNARREPPRFRNSARYDYFVSHNRRRRTPVGHASLPRQAAPPRSVAERMAVAPRAHASSGRRQEITATRARRRARRKPVTTSLRFQGRTFGAPGLTAPAVNSEDGTRASRGKSGQSDPP
jgi:hypothetical protein